MDKKTDVLTEAEKKMKKEEEEEEEKQKKKIEKQVKKAEDARKDEDFGKRSNQIAAGEERIKEIATEGRTEVKVREKWTAPETVRNVQGGTLCKGIYRINDIDELLEDRETVLQIKDDLVFKGPVSMEESSTVKITEQETTQKLKNKLDKSSSTKSGIGGASYFGVSLKAGHSENKETERKKNKYKEENSISVVTRQTIPVQSVDLEPKYLSLTKEAVDELKKIEAEIKTLNYKSKGHFSPFFKRFGSHVNHGVIDFGGILISKATSEGSSKEDEEIISKVVSKASETLLSLGILIGGCRAKVGAIYGAEEVFAETKGKYHNKETYNTKVTLSKQGGPPEINDVDQWRAGLVEFSSLYSIVRKHSAPIPIWEILSHNKGYEDAVLLAHAMKEEFSNLAKNTTTYRSLNTLRNCLDIWFQRYKNADEKNLSVCMKDLNSIRRDSDVNPTDWRDEVLYSPQVQHKILIAIQREERVKSLNFEEIFDSLRSILDPINQISPRHFPDIEPIKQVLSELNIDDNITPLEISTFSDLPQVLKELTADQHCNVKMLTRRLEAFLLKWKNENKVTEEFLVCICLLNRLGFSFRSFIFEPPVDKKNLEDIADLLNKHMSDFQLLENKKQKQAYVLDLVLQNPQKLQAVQYMMDEMEEVSTELTKAWSTVITFENTKEFEVKIQHYLYGERKKITLERLEQELKAKFQFIMPKKPLQRHEESLPQDISSSSCAEQILEQMEKLNMTKYFPQKLKYEDVIMLTADALQDFSHTPTTLKTIPWYFIKHIIGLDSNTRDNSVIIEQVDEKSETTAEATESDVDIDFSNLEFPDDFEEDKTTETGCDEESPIKTSSQEMHPLDLIYIIFLCADDFLRQELADKMLKNQYAIPLILPAPHLTTDSKSLMLHWCLRGISRTFTIKDTVLHKTLVDVKTPLVSCMSFGKETSLKSKLMNEFLSPQQKTFWHQELAGGHCKQTTSEGMVEVAWYLPGGHGDDKFNKAVTFTNLRGNASNHPTISDKLIEFSSATYIFTAKLDKEVFDFVKTRGANIKKLTLVVLHKDKERKSVDGTFKHFRDMLKMTNDQLITECENNRNFTIIARSLKQSLNGLVEEEKKHMSLTRLVAEIKADGSMEVDDVRCRQGEEAALNTLKDIDKLNREELGNTKQKILTSQSALGFRELMAKYDKEICRQKEKKPDEDVQDYVPRIEEKMQKLRLEHLHKPMSDTFMIFLKYLLNLDSTDRKYFLHCLKKELDERSEEIMQPLYKTYEQNRLKIEEISKQIKELKKKEQEEEEINRLKSEVENRQAELIRLDGELTSASFGLEHFFREIALVYENIATLKTQTKTEELTDILDALSGVVSEIFLEGTAIEIMDGDAIYVPVVWLNAVLNKIKDGDKARVFKMAILGAQSSGKSTILNTTFGLHFPVSSGKCTRGAHMQLVKVEEEFRKTLNCEYILVIDSEGLMSRTLTYKPEYDNELAAFVLGQADLTLVVIKGEGKEMEDVLPIAIHAFFRMKQVGELQGCHFVHQNMGSQDAKMKILTEMSYFVRTLDDKIRAAAKLQKHKYTEFADVLRYDRTKDNTFVPGLWDGSEPMGKVNVNYSSTMQQLKNEILQNWLVAKVLSTLKDSGKRLTEIWEGIRKENFVFNFKNVLAIETHQQLTNVFNGKQWDVKTEIRNKIQRQVATIQNKVQKHKNQNTVNSHIDNLIDEAKLDAYQEIGDFVRTLREDIKHYFVCNGQRCTLTVPCSKDVRYRHLIADNEREFMDDVKQLKTTVKEEAKASLNSLKIKLKAEVQINKMNEDMDTRLKKKVKEVVRTEKTKNMTSAEIKEKFNRLWAEETADIMEEVRREDKDVNIKAKIQTLVLKRLGRHNQMYRERAKDMGFLVKKTHVQRKEPSLTGLNEDDTVWLHEVSKKIIDTAEKWYRKTETEKSFQTTDAMKLIQHVLRLIRQIKDNTFETTAEYKADLLIHIKKLAVHSVPRHARKSTGQMIDQIVYSLLRPDECSMYEESLGFVVHNKHIETSCEKKDAKSYLQEKSKHIIESTESYYSLPTKGKKFEETDADFLFQEIHKQICEISEATIDYQVDLMMYIENLALEGFTELHKMYRNKSSPGALLEEKRNGYRASFMSLMKEGDSATTFCDSVLRHVVALNVDKRLTTNALFTEVRKYGGEIFRDVRGLQSAIMVDLYKENEFDKYLEYITCYETLVKAQLNAASIECLTEKDRLSKQSRLHKLAHEKLSKIIDEITEAVNAAVEGTCRDAAFISTLFSNLKEMSLPNENLAAGGLLEVTDKKQFGAIVIGRITGPIQEQIKDEINNWDVTNVLEERKWEEFIFDEVVGCTKRCPFCKVPCDIHTGGKRSGNHSATLHRPQGLGGSVWAEHATDEKQELVVEDCRSGMASTVTFRHYKSDGSVEWVPYKEYSKVHRDWNIRGDLDPDAEIYWKWVFARYNKEFAEYYNAKEANIPPEWSQYDRNDIQKDIEDHYKVEVDL